MFFCFNLPPMFHMAQPHTLISFILFITTITTWLLSARFFWINTIILKTNKMHKYHSVFSELTRYNVVGFLWYYPVIFFLFIPPSIHPAYLAYHLSFAGSPWLVPISSGPQAKNKIHPGQVTCPTRRNVRDRHYPLVVCFRIEKLLNTVLHYVED